MVTDAWAARSGLTAILITVPELAAYTQRWRSVSRSSARSQVPLTELIPPYGGEFPDPQPHLTISSSAQGGPAVVAEAQEALAAAPAPSIQLTELGLWREGDGVWRQFGAVPLGGQR